MLFKKKIVTPDMDDWHHDPNQLMLLDSQTKVSSLILSRQYIPKNTLVVFIGGAMDEVYRPLLNGVFIPYRLDKNIHQDTCYATHASAKQVTNLVKRWHQAGQKICLVGHSWGAKTIFEVAKQVAPKIRIKLLVTLDPVSRRLFRRQLKRPDNVHYWFNVHVDYKQASMEYSNVIARLGGYWGHCDHADNNIKLSRDKKEACAENGGEITHANAERMFLEVIDILRKL